MKVAKNACPKEIRMTLQWKEARFELALHSIKKKKGKNMNQTIQAEHFQRCPKCNRSNCQNQVLIILINSNSN